VHFKLGEGRRFGDYWRLTKSTDNQAIHPPVALSPLQRTSAISLNFSSRRLHGKLRGLRPEIEMHRANHAHRNLTSVIVKPCRIG
jgi:hypothetical protein